MAEPRFTTRESYVLPGRWTVVDAQTGVGVRRRSGSIQFFHTETDAIEHVVRLEAEQLRRAVCRACRHRTLAVEHVAGRCPQCVAAEKAEQETRV